MIIFLVCIRTPIPSFAPGTMQNMTVIRGDNVDLKCRIDNSGDYMVSLVFICLIIIVGRVFKSRRSTEADFLRRNGI
jgi:hypothetical protein